MQVINKDDVISLNLGNGYYRQVTHAELVDTFGIKRKGMTAFGSVRKMISLYKYAKTNGRFTSGAKTTKESLARMFDKINTKIDRLTIEEQFQALELLGEVPA